MSDVSSMNAIALGNARRDAVRQRNEQIIQHNNDVANQISSLKDQQATVQSIIQAKDTAQALWTGAGLPDKIKAYQDYKASRSGATNPTSKSETNLQAEAERNNPTNQATTPAQNPTEPPSEAVAEGSPSGASVSEEGATAESRLTTGLKNSLPLTEEGETALSKAGKVAGGFGAVALGGLDVYNDFKTGSFKLAGNNGWEKAGNVLQIGGSVADLVGTVYPPAKLLGGILDLGASATDEIGRATDNTTTQQDDALKQQETEGLQGQQEAETQLTGDTS
jgi:hypothetical protein